MPALAPPREPKRCNVAACTTCNMQRCNVATCTIHPTRPLVRLSNGRSRRSAPHGGAGLRTGSVLHTPIRETWRSWRTRVHQQRRVCRCACMCVQARAEARRRLLVGAHPVSTLVIAGAMPSCCNVATLQRVATHPRLHARHRRCSAGRLLRGAHARARSARCDCLRLLPLLWFAISAVLSCCGSHFTRVQEAMTRAWRKTCSTLPS